MSRTLIGYNLYLKDRHPARRTLLQPLGLPFLPVVSPNPTPTRIIDYLTGRPTEVPAYRLAIHRLTDDQLAGLIDRLAATFGVSTLEIAHQIAHHGVPILQRDCDPPVPQYARLM